MRILQINAVYDIASTGRSTAELHRYLKSHGHQSWVAAMNVPNCVEFFHLGNKIENRIHNLLSHITGRQGSFSTLSTRQLIQFIGEKNPDVVHLGVLHSNCINIKMLLSFLAVRNIPVVITLHDCWYFTGHCCYFTGAQCERWKNGCGHCPELHTWNRSWFFDRTQKNLETKRKLFSGIKKLAVVGVSDWVTGFVKDSILKDAYLIKRIYNWIDLGTFQPKERNKIRAELGLKDSFTIICIAQNWSVLKGLDDVITLAKRMSDCKILLVGTCPEEFLPLPENVISVGCTTSTAQLADYYSAADVFFNPSLQETFGKVTAESLACGTPVVGYGVTATIELVKPGCGYLIAPYDIDGAVEKINQVKMQGKDTFISACREFAVKTFNRECLIEENISVYKQLIDARYD